MKRPKKERTFVTILVTAFVMFAVGGTIVRRGIGVSHFLRTHWKGNTSLFSFAGKSNPLSSSVRLSKNVSDLARRAADTHGLDPALIKAIIIVESGANSGALSPRGAVGLMQLMPSTARFVGVRDLWNPTQNVHGGTKYLRYLLDTFDNNVPLALAAYNAGPGAVKKFRGIPPYPETRRYVAVVLTKYRQIQRS